MASNVSALKAFRKARGLCFTCGEKWAPGHKCKTSVQPHVVEELLEMLHLSDSDIEQHGAENEVFEDVVTDNQEVLISISKQALNGSEALHSLRLQGQIQGHDVLILVDSGSSSNFVSAKLAAKLQGVLRQTEKTVKVLVARGGVITMLETHKFLIAVGHVKGTHFRPP